MARTGLGRGERGIGSGALRPGNRGLRASGGSSRCMEQHLTFRPAPLCDNAGPPLMFSRRVYPGLPPTSHPPPAHRTETLPHGNRSGGSSVPAFREGELLAGRFRIVCLIGRGGMGEVYQADDTVLHESIALKTLRPAAVRRPE